MAPRLLLLSRNPDAHGVRRLDEAGAAHGCELLDPHAIRLDVDGGKLTAWTGPEGVGSHPHPERGQGPAPSGSFIHLPSTIVIPRIGSTSTEYSLAVLEHLEAGGARVLNPASGVAKLRSKFNMLGYLAAAGLPVPDSILLRAPADVEAAVHSLGGWPVVLKFIRGSQGLGVAIASELSMAVSVLEAMNYAQYDVLLQRYYAAAAQSDVRVLVLGGRARWGMRRIAGDGSFRSNIHRGGRAEPIDLAGEHAPYARLAEQAAAVFGLGLAGVDMFATDAGPVILEVNSSPGFEKPEELYGPVIADAIVEYTLSL
jgi:ribosomal protein S6--L-glutamate ligase